MGRENRARRKRSRASTGGGKTCLSMRVYKCYYCFVQLIDPNKNTPIRRNYSGVGEVPQLRECLSRMNKTLDLITNATQNMIWQHISRKQHLGVKSGEFVKVILSFMVRCRVT